MCVNVHVCVCIYACLCVYVHMCICVCVCSGLHKTYLSTILQERQLKTKLNKQLREKEDYILLVLAQKRKLEEQLNVKKKRKVSLQQVSYLSFAAVIICSGLLCL